MKDKCFTELRWFQGGDTCIAMVDLCWCLAEPNFSVWERIHGKDFLVLSCLLVLNIYPQGNKQVEESRLLKEMSSSNDKLFVVFPVLLH